MTIDTIPVAVGTALVLASIRWPRRWLPRLLAAVAGAVAVVGVARANGTGDLSDVGVAIAIATVVAALASRLERDGGVGPAALAVGGAAAAAAGLARLETATGGFRLPDGRQLEPQPGWLLVLAATAIVVAAARRPRRAAAVLLPVGLWLGLATGGTLEHGGDAIALVLALGGALAPHVHGAIALWALAAAATPVAGAGAAGLLAAAAVIAAVWLHPRAALAAAPGAAALAAALVDDPTPARLALAALAVVTVARLWRTDLDDVDLVPGRASPVTAIVAALAAWLLLAPETWTWTGDARLTGWGTGVLLAALAAAVGGYVALSVRGQDIELPALEVADPSYRPGEPRRAGTALVASLAILGLCGGWLLASSLQ
jgi:hypothetical protein